MEGWEASPAATSWQAQYPPPPPPNPLRPPHLQRARGQLPLSAHVQQEIQGGLCGQFC